MSARRHVVRKTSYRFGIPLGEHLVSLVLKSLFRTPCYYKTNSVFINLNDVKCALVDIKRYTRTACEVMFSPRFLLYVEISLSKQFSTSYVIVNAQFAKRCRAFAV